MRCLAVALVLLPTACGGVTAEQRALAFLFAQQGKDGGFHSQVYGTLRPGHSLTGLVLWALARCPETLREPYGEQVARAFRFLEAATDEKGGIGRQGIVVDYPNYTAAFAVSALCTLRPEGWRDRVARHLAWMRRTQPGEEQGFARADSEYGGFGFGGRPVQKPLGGELLNLSITCHVLEALRLAGVPAQDPAVRRAAVFVGRLQGPDGGFHYTTTPAEMRSKAGPRDGVPGSYGSMTADGVRSLLACGLALDDPAVRRAQAWLAAHRQWQQVPGLPAGDDEPSLRFYWLWSAAEALARLEPQGAWRAAIRSRVHASQCPDGSWAGPLGTMKEDDPLVATPIALLALAACRGN